MFKLDQKGIAHLLVPIILLIGLVAGVYLVGKETNIFPKAFSPRSLSGPIESPTPAPFTCSACAADIVKDSRNQVNAQDYAVLSSCFNKSTSTTLSGGRSCAPADINKDGKINQADADCLKSVYMQRCTATPAPTPVNKAFSMEVKISSNLEVGKIDSPNVFIDNAIDLGYFSYTLKFDPTKLKVLNMSLERFLGSTGRQVHQLGPVIDNVKGTVNFGGYTLGASPAGPNGKGVLAIFNVQALAPGTTSITISYAKATDQTGTKIQPVGNLIPGTVNITAPAAKRVFVTNGGFSGNLGGLSGADIKCQFAANDAKLGGTWKAWLSAGTTSAASRLTHNSGPYKLINGRVVANNWADLTDGTLQNGINVTEVNQVSKNRMVWTGTQANGNIGGPYICNNWQLGDSSQSTLVGDATQANYKWTGSNAYSCASVLPLYCFEQ